MQTVDWDIERECAGSSSCALEPTAMESTNASAGGDGVGPAGGAVRSNARRGAPTAAEKVLVALLQEKARQ